MNLQNIISEIEQVDPEVYDRLDTRRSAMKSFANMGGKLALTAIPFALGGMFKKAYGQTPADVVDVLQFALTLEYLEAEYYNLTLVASGLNATLTGGNRTAYQKIAADENAHVTVLANTIRALGATPVAKPRFDFTAGNGSNTGPFSGPLSPFVNYGVNLAIAQAFEDTGVRAYKGQAGRLVNNNDVLTAALQIHSVEARHAAHIRSMRRSYAAATTNALALIPAGVTVKPWITLNQSGIDSPAVQASYNGEENVIKAGVNITTVGGINQSAATASEGFDEPLTKEQVLAIVDPFIV